MSFERVLFYVAWNMFLQPVTESVFSKASGLLKIAMKESAKESVFSLAFNGICLGFYFYF